MKEFQVSRRVQNEVSGVAEPRIRRGGVRTMQYFRVSLYDYRTIRPIDVRARDKHAFVYQPIYKYMA